MADIAQKYPDRYTELSKTLSDIGRQASYFQGETVTLADMKPSFDKSSILKQMDRELDDLSRKLTGKDLEAARIDVFQRYATDLEKLTRDTALQQGNNLASAVVSGARGSPLQLKAMLTTPGVYQDFKGRTIPLFVRRSFGEGLRPAEYLASTYGVRTSVISTKAATAKAGDVGKQLQQATADLVVTEDDCGSTNGIDMETEDPDLMGRVLARSYGGVKAGTPVDKKVASELRRQGVGNVMVRSVLTCQAKQGVCAHDLGLLPGGKFAPIGYSAGITAAQSISEQLAQGSLNCLVEGTLVRMADGTTKAIQDIKPGEMVLGANLKGETFPTCVSHVWDQGMQPTQRYSYRLGSTQQLITLEATEEHPLLVNKRNYGHGSDRNNAQLLKLKAGYKHADIGAVLPINSKWDGQHEQFALWLGIYLGGGIRNTPGTELRFSCADPKLIEDLNQHSLGLNLRCRKRKRSFDWRIGLIKDTISQDAVTGRVTAGLRNPLKVKLNAWGLLHKHAYEKQLPPEVWSWSTNSVAHLVAGYLATDGSVYQNKDGHIGLSFGSTSRLLLEGLKELLAVRLCVYSSAISQTGAAGSGNHVHDMWQFYITRIDQVERLMQLMPRVPGVKGATLQAYIQNAKYVRRHDEGFYRAKRVTIEQIGSRHCWDITVDNEDHLFVLANNIICSNTKHSGGASKGKQKAFSGFAILNQVLQSPETFPHKAAVSEVDGKVHKIEDAPQGGKYIWVGEEKHFALPGYEPIVQVGAEVEAGDQLSDGLVDVADIARLRGLGEARQAYVKQLKQILGDSGVAASKGTLELISKGTLDHVRIDSQDGLGNYLPDDVASYNVLSSNYSPPKDAAQLETKKAIGQYLHQPVMHYTIGTRVTPRIAQHMQTAGQDKVLTSPEPPPFTPEMTRLRGAQYSGDDWLAKMHTSFLGPNLKADAARARDTQLSENIHFAPRLMIGEDFGKRVHITGKF